MGDITYRRYQNFTTGIYIAKILKTLNLESCTGEDLPFISEYNSSQDITSDTHAEAATNELRTILGLLNHPAIHTRPEVRQGITTKSDAPYYSQVEDSLSS